MTLLENLIKVSKQQGGTIHQFIDVTAKNYDDFVKLYNDYSSLFEFNSLAAFKKLADRIYFNGLKF